MYCRGARDVPCVRFFEIFSDTEIGFGIYVLFRKGLMSVVNFLSRMAIGGRGYPLMGVGGGSFRSGPVAVRCVLFLSVVGYYYSLVQCCPLVFVLCSYCILLLVLCRCIRLLLVKDCASGESLQYVKKG